METKQIIDKLNIFLYNNKENECMEMINKISRRNQFLNFIKTVVKKGCFVYAETDYTFIRFENGYKPKIYLDDKTTIKHDFRNVFGIGCNYIAMPKKTIHLSDLTNEQLKIICKILYEYAFHYKYKSKKV